MDRELLLLMLRNAIADKEWSIACANMETSRSGAWTSDWNIGIREADKQARDLVRQIANLEDAA